MSTAATVPTPSDQHVRLTALSVDHVTDPNNQQRYQLAIWYLMHARICNPLDIAFALSAVSQFSHNAGPSHSTAVRRIFRYLSGTSTHGIMYGAGVCGGYTDADWGTGEDRKSIGGYVFLINRGAISCASKKQTSVASPSTEAEYMALTQEVKESLWLGDLLGDIGALKPRTAIQHIQGHNQGALAITKNCESQARMKHIDIQYHFIPQHVEQGSIELTYCPTQGITVDIFTKPLP